MNLLYVIDEHTDVKQAPAVQQMVEILLDAVHNPQKPRPVGEHVSGEIMRE